MGSPELKDYGLTAAEVERIPALRQRRDRPAFVVFVVSSGTVALSLGVLMAMHDGGHPVSGFIIGFLLSGIPCGLVCGMILSFIVYALVPTPPSIAAYERYERDLKAYEARVAEEERQRLLAERRKQLDFWCTLDGFGFEREVSVLLRRLGHKVEMKGGSGDEGVDLVVDGEAAVQCKQHAKPVAPATARELYGAMHHAGAKRGILVCPRGFTTGTVEFARKVGLELWDGDHLIEMSRRADVAARRRQV